MPGQVLLEYRDLTFDNEESTRAAEAAACANEQGQFWAYHEQLFLHQRPSDVESFSDEQVREIAGEVGLDREAFDTCLVEGRFADEIAAMQAEARELELDSTPTLVINGEIVPFESYDQIRARIDAALDE